MFLQEHCGKLAVGLQGLAPMCNILPTLVWNVILLFE
jgi:hypothetical protein